MKKLIAILLLCISGLLLLTPASAEESSPKLVLSETEIRLAVGKNAALKATVENPPAGKKGKAAWESSDPVVCTVSAAGAVKAVSEGTAVVTCTMELPEGGTLAAECKVTTFVEAKTLKAVNAAVRLNVGETAAGEYELLPENTTEKTLEWSSADEAIVTVNAEGRMTGVAPGTTKVTGVTKDGSNRKAVYTVYVPTLAVPETEYTISEMSGLTIPVSYYGDDFEKNITVKVTGKPVLYTTQYENNRIELHLDALEAGDSKIEIADKKDGKAKLALTVHTEETAIWNSLLVEIAGLKLQWKRGDLFLSYNFINHSSRKVTGVKYALDFRTQSGGQEFYPCLFEGTDIPSVGQFWSSSLNMASGARGSVSYYPTLLKGEYITNKEITEIRCAITWIGFDDESSVEIPESQLCWYSSNTGYLQKPNVRENYTAPAREIQDKAESFPLGCAYTHVFDYKKSWFGVSESGLYITHVEPGSIAEKCGLQLKDLVVEMDGISFAEEKNMDILGMAKVADGETVIFKVLRDGEVVELEVHK